jgi:starvation-inducible outer membrane lipoprotein
MQAKAAVAVALAMALAGCSGAPDAIRATSAYTYQLRVPIRDVASEQVATRERLAARATEVCHGQYWFLMEQFSTHYREPALIWDISCANPAQAHFEKGTR